MSVSSVKNEIQQLGRRWHKLIFLCNRNYQFDSNIPITDSFEKINVNLVLSEELIHISQKNYPLHVEDILQNVIIDTNQTYLLQHIDILFDPVLQVHPVRLLENISKNYKLIVEWPGKYEDGRLVYAEYGHPEYFTCNEFEGKVFLK